MTHSDVANFQKRLSFYCGSDSVVDAFPVAFLDEFFGPAGLPSLDLANVRRNIFSSFYNLIFFATCKQTCNINDNTTFPGSALPNCSALAADIKTCQSQGRIVTLSMGGQSGAVGFTSDAQAVAFADQVYYTAVTPVSGC